MSTPLLPVRWRPREVPLAPVAVAARGKAARVLGARLLAHDDQTLARWHGLASATMLLLLGEGAELPWADGVVYLGRDPEAPALLLPTTMEASVPAALLQRALLGHAALAPPVAVLLEPPEIVAAGLARPILRAELLRWLEAGR